LSGIRGFYQTIAGVTGQRIAITVAVMEWIFQLSSAISAFFFALIPSFGSVQTYAASFPAPAAKPVAEIVFGGDVMLDRTVRQVMEDQGDDYIFSCIDDVLRSADMVVVNLEGPITASSSKSVGTIVGGEGNYTFTFAPATASLLQRHNIRIVNIGNNHVMDFGRSGLAETREYLSQAGVGYFGDPDAGESERVLRTEVGGIAFSFVNWSDWTSDKTDHTVAQVRAEAQSGRVVVVYTHWGEEYVPAIPRVKELAHQFVDAGAAVVVGSHPHIVQEHELYHGKNIYYSIGNFIFDQYWNEDVRTGLLLRISFTPAGVSAVEEIPVHLERDRRTCPVR
jgi:poly-gamma-glutamate synthesis protein (capsule biosynthesis protein)